MREIIIVCLVLIANLYSYEDTTITKVETSDTAIIIYYRIEDPVEPRVWRNVYKINGSVITLEKTDTANVVPVRRIKEQVEWKKNTLNLRRGSVE